MTPKELFPFIAKQGYKRTAAAGGKQGYKRTLINPTNAKPQHYYYHQTLSSEIQYALECSKQAQAKWATESPAHRASILRTAAEIMSQNKDMLSQLETSDTGRVIRETTFDVNEGIECLHYYASLANTLGGEMYKLSGSNLGYTLREPLGVTVGIGAWNYPINTALWKSAPALAFGNSMIFKPSEYTPSTALWLAECYAEAGVPDGLFQVVLGDGHVGKELVISEEVSKISFTGSYPVGKQVYEMAARGMKKVTLELGGKSPFIIFEDADLDNAVSAAMMANWYSNGQVCSNGTRIFVHESIMADFVDRLVERTKKLRIGDPSCMETDIGPMVHQDQFEKVLRYIDIGREEGATLLHGGTRVHDLPDVLKDGYFLTPAIFTNCTDEMTQSNEEVFGMLMSILSFSSEEEAISRANNTEFGLAAGVFTKDIQRAHRVVAALQAGVTYINNYNLAPMNLPWGGTKHSGIGRENGIESVTTWTQQKSVYVEMGNVQCEYPR